MRTSKNLTLAIETAVEGGSLSLLEGQTEVDFWIGRRGISKAEDILENIYKLFKANRITGENIERIIISTDVGSNTGLKIGLATAKGLAKAFSSRLVAVSLIDSLVNCISNADAHQYVIALPVGKNNIFYARFSSGNQTEMPAIVKSADFFAEDLVFEGNIYAHQKIIDSKAQFNVSTKQFSNIGENMAKINAAQTRPITIIS